MIITIMSVELFEPSVDKRQARDRSMTRSLGRTLLVCLLALSLATCSDGSDDSASSGGTTTKSVDVGTSDDGKLGSGDALAATDVAADSDTTSGGADTASGGGDALVGHDSSVPPPDAGEVPCKCGDGVCNFALGCEENYANCSADCAKTCGDGVCAPGENPSNCKVDCCGGCGDGLCKGYACGENSTTCAQDCGKACGNQVCGKGENPDTCPEDCKFKACGNQICEGGESPETCPQDCGTACGNCKCEKGEDWQSCPVDCAWCGDGVCSPCDQAKETEQTCAFDCAEKECYPKSTKPQIACSDGNPCTKDVCNKQGKCQHVDAAVDIAVPPTCTDNNVCTLGDLCTGGSCKAGAQAKPCDDGNPCTKDFCDPVDGCGAKALKGKPCDDGDGCTDLDNCQGGVCKGYVKDCNDSKPCTKDSCDKDFGCAHLPLNATPCSDGDACTVNDLCKTGTCKSGAKANCDDNNSCTLDTCDANKGCSSVAKDGNSCSDGNACTKNDGCKGVKCVGSLLSCDDANVCTTESCDKDKGCQYQANTSACDDGDGCTVKDVCKAKKCTAGVKKNCDDSSKCTTDSCAKGDCVHKAIANNNVSCSDGLTCTVGDTCKLGVCQGTSKFGLKTYQISGQYLDEVIALLPRGTDGWWLFGRLQSQGLTKSWDITVIKLDKNFKQLSSATYTGYENNYMTAAAINSKGVMAVVGWQTGTPTEMCLPFIGCKTVPCPDCSYDYMFVRFSAAGKPETGETKASSWKAAFSKHQQFRDVAAMPDDGFVAVGVTAGKSTQRPVLRRFKSATGGSFPSTCASYGPDDAVNDYFNAVKVHKKITGPFGSSYSIYALGGAVEKGVHRGFLQRFSTSCKLSWQAKLADMPVGPGEAIVVRKDGIIQTFGHAKATWTAAVTSSGKVLWTKTYDKHTNVVDARLVTDGSLFVASKNLVRLDTHGNIVWSSLTSGLHINNGLSFDSAGAPIVLGSVQASSGDSALIRFDQWGHSNCSKAGACSDQPLSKCDDKNPCTVDLCSPTSCAKDPVTGNNKCEGAKCSHNNLGDGAVCATGKACKVGKCQ